MKDQIGRTRPWSGSSSIALVLAFSTVALAAEESKTEPPCHTVEPRKYSRTVAEYSLPVVTLQDQDGRAVSLRSALGEAGPVALNFVFTTCTTICPVMTATFAQMRRELGGDSAGLRVVSISIDPEYDTPSVLRAYAQKHSAAGDWRFLTGRSADIQTVLRAFEAYAGAKTNHRPLSFFRRDDGSWVRIEGLAGAAELAQEFRTRESD
jgi:protein SCO1